ncbi:MAG: hypothetical protein HY753_06405 [Nitrospirae bacterium]|nr:hypothetical protein [Nitrospirota bacterium]
MEIKCYGWIPILSSYLLTDNFHTKPSDIFPKSISDTDASQTIDGSLTFDDNQCITSITLDIPEIASVQVSCDMASSGLVFFQFNEVSFSPIPLENTIFNENALPTCIFDIIRDIYHDHVHHGKDSDCKLSPVIAKDEDEAVKKLLNQYQNKIIEYHKDFKLIKNCFYLSPARIFKLKSKKQLYFLTTGSGEFIYAQSFINLHEDIINRIGFNVDTVNKSFELANKSVTTLKDKLSWRIMYIISITAMVIALFALISAIEPTYKIYKKIFPPKEAQQLPIKNN